MGNIFQTNESNGNTTITGSLTITPTTNQLVLGTTHTITIDSVAPAASEIYTIPDAGSAANFVLDQGNYTIAGTWTFSNNITLASSKAIVFTDNTTNTVTMEATNSTTSYTLKLPTTSGTSGYFLQTNGSGVTSWQPGGSGTISSGTAGQLAVYTGSTTVGSTGETLSSGKVVGVDGSGYPSTTAQALSMQSEKITSLANGSANTDAVAFGQILGQRILQIASATYTSNTTTTSASYVSGGITMTYTPTVSTSKVIFIVTTQLIVAASNTLTLTIRYGSTDLAVDSTGLANSAVNNQSLMMISPPYSPGNTTATGITVYIKTNSGGASGVGQGNNTSYIYAIEIG